SGLALWTHFDVAASTLPPRRRQGSPKPRTNSKLRMGSPRILWYSRTMLISSVLLCYQLYPQDSAEDHLCSCFFAGTGTDALLTRSIQPDRTAAHRPPRPLP